MNSSIIIFLYIFVKIIFFLNLVNVIFVELIILKNIILKNIYQVN